MTNLICYWLVIVDCAVLAGACFVLIWSNDYKDGVIGRIGFVLLILSSIFTISDMLIAGVEYTYLPETILSRTGSALLVASITVRHLRWAWFGKTRRVQDEIFDKAAVREEQKLCR